jgi:hypothetical protein
MTSDLGVDMTSAAAYLPFAIQNEAGQLPACADLTTDGFAIREYPLLRLLQQARAAVSSGDCDDFAQTATLSIAFDVQKSAWSAGSPSNGGGRRLLTTGPSTYYTGSMTIHQTASFVVMPAGSQSSLTVITLGADDTSSTTIIYVDRNRPVTSDDATTAVGIIVTVLLSLFCFLCMIAGVRVLCSGDGISSSGAAVGDGHVFSAVPLVEPVHVDA